MKLLLDTQVFLWFISGDRRLPDSWRDAIRDPGNAVYLSVASVWEAVIKQQAGKLPLPEPADSLLPVQRKLHQIASLPIDESSVEHLSSLPALHRDPFDRMLVCQALAHGLTVVTVDPVFRAYPAPLLDRT